jgi:hypothetical protein
MVLMNVFFVDSNPKQAAEWLVDRHVVKMQLEGIQLLSTAHRILDGQEYAGKSISGKRNVKRWRLNDDREEILYSATHINHPSAIWCRQTSGNYLWLLDHTISIIHEYTYRYGKIHSFFDSELLKTLFNVPKNIRHDKMFSATPAMDKSFIISNDSVTNYRNYYINGKKHLHSWKNRPKPWWIEE